MNKETHLLGTEASAKSITQLTQSGVRIVTLADLKDLDCEAPLCDIRSVDCHSFMDPYHEAAEEAKTAGNDRAALAYRLLADVSGIHFKPEDRAEPYGPRWVAGDRRTIVPGDLRGEQSAAFAAIAPRFKNPGLRARLADIAWINDRRLAASAHLAISSYCEAVCLVADGKAEFFLSEQSPCSHTGMTYLRRACQIAQATGWKTPEANDLKSVIERITQYAFDGRDAVCYVNSAKLNLDYRIANPDRIAIQAEALAGGKGLDPLNAHSLWIMAARAHHFGKKPEESNRCRVEAAECHVAMAEAADFKGMAASSWLMDAISALRQLPGTKERRMELESRLREAQASIHEEMGMVSKEIDLTEIIDQSLGLVRGLTLPQAILKFLALDRSPTPEHLRQEVLDQAHENSFLSAMPMTVHDAEGRVVAKSPGLGGAEGSNDEAVRHLIARNEAFRRQVTVSGAIEPARLLIMAEHLLHTQHFLTLAGMSPFVPYEHTEIYARGFAWFFGGDFISALHVLVPQLENSLRYVLKQAGFNPATILSDMTQESRTISVMLEKDRAALEKIFGPAIVFEIENIFDFRGGPSLRHYVAHGLMPAADFYSHNVIYACWFIFKLCCLPLLRKWEDVEKVLQDL